MPTLRSYITGFAVSVTLTLMAFGLVLLHAYTGHAFPTHTGAKAAFVVLALLQLGVQLAYFLHIGKERKTHWNVAALGFTLFIVAVVVGGTLWIMHNVHHAGASEIPFDNGVISAENQHG